MADITDTVIASRIGDGDAVCKRRSVVTPRFDPSEIGKVAANIAEKHHDLKDWQSGHELAFIFDTKKALS